MQNFNFNIKLFREYSVNRLVELQKDKLNSYKNDCGGRFMDDNWISAFPTDSQVINFFVVFIVTLKDI